MYAACDHDSSQALWAKACLHVIQNGDATQISLHLNLHCLLQGSRAGFFFGREFLLARVFLLSPIFLCRKIKDGGYNNTNMNKVWPTKNTPALQAKRRSDIASANFVANWTDSGYQPVTDKVARVMGLYGTNKNIKAAGYFAELERQNDSEV